MMILMMKNNRKLSSDALIIIVLFPSIPRQTGYADLTITDEQGQVRGGDEVEGLTVKYTQIREIEQELRDQATRDQPL